MHHPTDRIAHTTAFVTPVMDYWLEREIAQWVHPMKDRSDDPSHHLLYAGADYRVSNPVFTNIMTDDSSASKGSVAYSEGDF